MVVKVRRWEDVYQNSHDAETSWFEVRPQTSPELIPATAATGDAAIVDLGAGSSRLTDCLFEQGFRRITALNLSESALAKARVLLPIMYLSTGFRRTRWNGIYPDPSMFGMTGLRSIF